MFILFDSAAIVKPTTFAADLFPPAASAPQHPGKKTPIGPREAVRTRDDIPSEADQRWWAIASNPERQWEWEAIEVQARDAEAQELLCRGRVWM